MPKCQQVFHMPYRCWGLSEQQNQQGTACAQLSCRWHALWAQTSMIRGVVMTVWCSLGNSGRHKQSTTNRTCTSQSLSGAEAGSVATASVHSAPNRFLGCANLRFGQPKIWNQGKGALVPHDASAEAIGGVGVGTSCWAFPGAQARELATLNPVETRWEHDSAYEVEMR
jgi:hypothetical protein